MPIVNILFYGLLEFPSRTNSFKKKGLPVHYHLVFGLVFLGMVVEATGQSQHQSTHITYIEPNDETGSSLATVVGNVPLAFTDQIFPLDKSGNLVGGTDIESQVIQVFKNMEMMLESAGTDLSNLLRINVYLQHENHAQQVLEEIRELLPEGAFPAITLINGGQPREKVLLTMDGVATAPHSSNSEGAVSLHLAEGLNGKTNRSGVAILPSGRKVFISGQAEPGDDLLEASDKTMQNLFATLAYIGASARDVVQIKAFINPIEDAAAVEEVIVAFFRGQKAPPIVMVEWLQEESKAEIELIASAPENTNDKEAVSYYAPPWMSQATTFSRVVDVKSGGLFFTSGLYAEEGSDEEAKARNLFRTLSRLLQKAGSDYDNLVKATYYPSHEKGREGLVNVRTEFYNPERPPAASLIRIQGTGRQGVNLNVDMIGVVPN
ncbi:MAG: RidA family protein [Cyclobacteriaceae bacterium]